MSVYMPTTLHDHPFVCLPGCVIVAYGTVYCILILVFGKDEIGLRVAEWNQLGDSAVTATDKTGKF